MLLQDLLEEFSQFLPVPVGQGGKKKPQKPKTQKRVCANNFG